MARCRLLIPAAALASMLSAAVASTAISATPRAAAVKIPSAIAWTGKVRIFAGGREIAIGASTRVEPFGAVRSDTWLLSDGPSSTRSMIIDSDAGWMEHGGKREPMPEPMLKHERQQFGMYTLMLLAPALRKPGITQLTIAGIGDAPTTVFHFGRAGRLIEATNSVSDPDGGSRKIDQVFRFSGDMASNGVHWPRRIELFEAGKRYFILEIESFRAE